MALQQRAKGLARVQCRAQPRDLDGVRRGGQPQRDPGFLDQFAQGGDARGPDWVTGRKLERECFVLGVDPAAGEDQRTACEGERPPALDDQQLGQAVVAGDEHAGVQRDQAQPVREDVVHLGGYPGALAAAGRLLAQLRLDAQVLDLLAEGLGVTAIAGRIYLSESTTKSHVGRIYDKLGASNRAQALVTAMRMGLIDSAAPPR